MRALQLAGTIAFVVLMLGVLAWTALSPRFALVSQLGEPTWITSAPARTTSAQVARISELPVTTFVRDVLLPEGTESPRLELTVEALRGFVLRVNDCQLAMRSWDEGSWRQATSVETTECLQAGSNRIEVDVTNHRGPPLLRLSGHVGGLSISSDSHFRARALGGAEEPAVPADDRLLPREGVTGPVVGPGFQHRWELLFMLLLAGVALAFGAAERPDLAGRYGPAALLVAATAFWGWLFLAKFQQLPAYTGFDGPDHLKYVRFLLEQRALPTAYDGHQMYQPPLFYLASAGLVSLFGGTERADQIVLHILPFLSGVVQVVSITALARTLFPEDRLRQGAALVVSASLPLNVYMAAYLSNEVLYGALSSLAILVTTRLLLARRTSRLAATGVGALAGLAVLSKVSGLLLLPTMVAFLFVRDWLVARAGLATSLGRGAALLGAALFLIGGLFARNLRLYGSAVVGNWDIPGQQIAWWQSPGFHTPEYFLRVGEVLRRPFFASGGSFWDGLYSTFFGDGLVGGLSGWRHRHDLWDYDLMAAGYVLALPAALLLLLGFGLLVRQSFRDRDPARRVAMAFALTLTVGTVFATLLLNIDNPAYSMAHARYLLCILAPLTLCFVEGFAWVDAKLSREGLEPLRIGYRGWAGALAMVWALSFAT